MKLVNPVGRTVATGVDAKYGEMSTWGNYFCNKHTRCWNYLHIELFQPYK